MPKKYLLLSAACALAGLACAAIAESPPNVAWMRQLGTSSTEQSYAVAVDAVGNAYISGTTDGSLGAPMPEMGMCF